MAGRPTVKRTGKADLSDLGKEVNLIPFMDVFCTIIVVLVLFVLVIPVGIIDVVLPAAAQEVSSTEQEQQKEEQNIKPKLNLTVAITRQGFIIAGYGGILDVAGVCGLVSAPQQEGAMPKYIIPKRPDGRWDLDCLQKNLIRIKESYPDQFSIIILPEWDIVYQTIIDVMDVAREYIVEENEQRVTRIMFPSPVLAAGVIR